jgi:lactate racemase
MTAKICELACGSDRLQFTLPGEAHTFGLKEPDKAVDEEIFADRLDAFLDRAAPDLTAPAVVVADKTRLCGYPAYLPVLLGTLAAHGAAPRRIRIFIAYGTHAPQSEAESRRAYGEVYGQYERIPHNCREATFVDLGRTRRGTPVRLRADIHAASCLITFGAISHHYFAGYGGGRKLIFPGLGEQAAIYANHGLFLDRAARRLAPGCRSGRLDGNPLAEDLAECESFRPADLAVHGLLNSHGEVCDLLVGQGVAHFRQACARHAAHCEVAAERSYDLVLASCGGRPKDINFIQSHKSIHHAADFVRDGGRLIVLAECPDGIGSQTFLPWFEAGGWERAFDRLAAGYVGNGGTALAMMAKSARIRVSLVTRLAPEIARRIGVAIWSPEQVQACLDHHQGSLAVIPNAGMVVRQAAAEENQG